MKALKAYMMYKKSKYNTTTYKLLRPLYSAAIYGALTTTSMHAYALGDLILSEQQRQQIDALRKGAPTTQPVSGDEASVVIKKTQTLNINGFYYRQGEPYTPRLWVNGKRANSRILAPSIAVRDVDEDKQTLNLSQPEKKHTTKIKAGQSLDVDTGSVKDTHESQ